MKYAIRIVGLHGTAGRQDHTLRPGWYLASYDPDGEDGYGTAEGTPDASKALQFESVFAAAACWRQQSAVRPWRADGQPNRPLTAVTIEVVPL